MGTPEAREEPLGKAVRPQHPGLSEGRAETRVPLSSARPLPSVYILPSRKCCAWPAGREPGAPAGQVGQRSGGVGAGLAVTQASAPPRPPWARDSEAQRTRCFPGAAWAGGSGGRVPVPHPQWAFPREPRSGRHSVGGRWEPLTPREAPRGQEPWVRRGAGRAWGRSRGTARRPWSGKETLGVPGGCVWLWGRVRPSGAVTHSGGKPPPRLRSRGDGSLPDLSPWTTTPRQLRGTGSRWRSDPVCGPAVPQGSPPSRLLPPALPDPGPHGPFSVCP